MSTLDFPVSTSRGRNSYHLLAEFAILLLGVSVFIRVRFGGDLFLTEVCLLILMPYLLFRCEPISSSNGTQRLVLFFGYLWLLAQLLSDIVRASALSDWTRGGSKIAFLLINFIALRRLLNTERRILMFAAGIALGGAYRPISLQHETQTSWKFGLGYSLALLALVVCSYAPLRRIRWIVPVSMLPFAVISAFEGSRNLAGICIMGAAILGVGIGIQKLPSISRSVRYFAAFGLVYLGVSTYIAYGNIAASGLLGETEKQKFYEQTQRGSGSLLLGGRSEWRVSLRAVRDSPLIGHGSWAKNEVYVANYRAQLSAETGEVYVAPTGDVTIPSHSYILGAWVEAGFLGAVFWLVVFGVVIRALFGLLTWRFPLGPIAVLVGCSLLWDIPFSPFGGDRRVHVAFALVLLPIASAHALSKPARNRVGRTE